ncbi:MAG: terminase small subunit [Bacillota bacterium]|nr:terminase small subunit [Bacillota bacterium]
MGFIKRGDSLTKLTYKQRAFADFYIELGNATEAAVKAGYSKKTARAIASENLKKINVKVYIDERLKQIESDRIASAAEVMKYLTSVLRGEQLEEVVVVEASGDGLSAARNVKKEVSAKDRLKAAELMGKRYSLFNDKVNFEGALPVVISGEDELDD